VTRKEMEDARREARDVLAGIARGDARRLAAHVLTLADKAEALRNEIKMLRSDGVTGRSAE
jgi:hypothetical protein